MKKLATLLFPTILCLMSLTACVPSRSGMVAYYPFNGNANDESGNGNDGKVFGATLTVDRFGRENSAFAFDGVDDYIDCGNGSSVDLAGSSTISVWVCHGKGNEIVAKEGGNEASPNGYYLWIHETSLVDSVIFGFNGGETEISCTVRSDPAVWTHVAGTWDSAARILALYVNGVLQREAEQVNGTGRGDSSPLYIGLTAAPWAPDFYFGGKIDDVRIYDRALSREEVKKLYTTH